MAVEHPLHDEWWDERDLVPLLDRVEVPTYLGCDWQNVPLHLPSTFPAFRALVNAPEVRVAMLGEFGLTWPWESLHVEALAWYDHWLKGRDTGILDGDPIRYWMPGADEWRTSTAVAAARGAAARLRAPGRRRARRRRGPRRCALADGARDGSRPGEAERGRSALDARVDDRAARRRRSTSPAISSSSCTRPRPRSTPRGSSRSRTSRPTARPSTSPPGTSARASARSTTSRACPVRRCSAAARATPSCPAS